MSDIFTDISSLLSTAGIGFEVVYDGDPLGCPEEWAIAA